MARPSAVNRPQVQTRREAPPQTAYRQSTVRTVISSQPSFQQREAPRVYALPAPAHAENNDQFFNRQHHNQWRPVYNYYNGQYNFYPYVDVTSQVELSANCVAVLFNGQTYYYDRGSFYVQDPQGYLAVPPPIGIIVNALPTWARQIGNIDGQIYYRCKGVIYIQVEGGFQVVSPAQGLPENA
jgi:Family of unknown function (DUF6515)